jgi:hypothetical protein
MEASSQFHAKAILHPGKEPLVTTGQGLGGPQNRSGSGDDDKNSPKLLGIDVEC